MCRPAVATGWLSGICGGHRRTGGSSTLKTQQLALAMDDLLFLFAPFRPQFLQQCRSAKCYLFAAIASAILLDVGRNARVVGTTQIKRKVVCPGHRFTHLSGLPIRPSMSCIPLDIWSKGFARRRASVVGLARSCHLVCFPGSCCRLNVYKEARHERTLLYAYHTTANRTLNAISDRQQNVTFARLEEEANVLQHCVASRCHIREACAERNADTDDASLDQACSPTCCHPHLSSASACSVNWILCFLTGCSCSPPLPEVGKPPCSRLVGSLCGLVPARLPGDPR